MGRRDEDVNEGTTSSSFFSMQIMCFDPRTGVQEVAGWGGGGSLGDAGAADVWGAHLCEHLVQPLQGAV